MATCGYLCPKCEGRGFDDDGIACDWCNVEANEKAVPKNTESDLDEWIKAVHEGPCCSD